MRGVFSVSPIHENTPSSRSVRPRVHLTTANTRPAGQLPNEFGAMRATVSGGWRRPHKSYMRRLGAQQRPGITLTKGQSSPVLRGTPPRERDIRDLRAGVFFLAGLTVARGILRRTRAFAGRTG